MTLVKGKLCFEQSGYGWTENYFQETSDDTLTTSFASLEKIATKRAACLAAEATITFITISAETDTGDSIVGNFKNTPYTGNSQFHSANPFTALLVRRRGQTGNNRSQVYLRGIPDDLEQNGGKFTPAEVPDWTKYLDAFTASMRANAEAWGFLGRHPTNSGKALVQTITQNANGQPVVTFKTNLFTDPAEIGKKVRLSLSGVQGAASVNGTRVVVPTSQTVAEFIDRIPMFPYTGGGTGRVSRPGLVVIHNQTPLRIVSRKPGAPLFRSRGRSRERKLA